MKKKYYILLSLSILLIFIGCSFNDNFTGKTLKAVEDLKATTDKTDKIVISWTYPETWEIEGFHIYRSAAKSGEFELLESVSAYTTSYTDSVGMLRTFYYYVTAYKGNVNGQIPQAVMGSSTFSYPGDFSFTADINGVTLHWTAIPGIASYRIYTANYSWSDFDLLIETTGTSYLHSDATDTNLYYKISAVLDNKESELSPSVMASTTALPAPANFLAAGTYESVHLSWDAVDGAHSYRIFKSSSSSSSSSLSEIAEVDTTGYTDSDATTSTRYYAVSAVKANGDTGSRTDKQSCALQTLEAPGGLTGQNVSSGWFELNWTAAAGAESYEIYRYTTSSTSATVLIGTTTTTSFQENVSQLTPRVYYYRVKSVLKDVVSSFSNYCSIFVLGKPSVSSIVEANSGLRVSWNISGAPAGTQINIYRSSRADADYVLIATANAGSSPYLDNGQTICGIYYYRITVLLNEVESPASNTVSGELSGAVTGMLATDGTELNSVTISWNTNRFADYYRVYYSATSEGTYNLLADNVAGTTYQHVPLGKGDRYYYKVAAVQSGTQLPASAIDSGEAFGVAPAAPSLSTLGLDGNIRITFYATPGARRYEIGVYIDDEFRGLIADTGSDTYFTISQSPILFNPPEFGFYTFRIIAYFSSTGIPTAEGTSELGVSSDSVLAGL